MSKAVIDKTEGKMKSAVEFAKEDFETLRTGKANAKMLDGINVDYWGTPTPINQIAGISVPEPSQILIKPYDTSALKDIANAIINLKGDPTVRSFAVCVFCSFVIIVSSIFL